MARWRSSPRCVACGRPAERQPGRPADRPVAPRLDAGRARQPGPERVRRRRSRAGSATPTRTSSRTRPSTRPTARSPSASAASASGRGSAGRSGCPPSPTTRAFATNGDRVANRAELIPTLAARFAERTSADWLAALDAAEVPAGPINDVAAAFASPWAAGRDGRARPSAARARSARSRRRSTCPRRRRRSARRRRCSASTPTRSSPSSATGRTRSPALARGGYRLSGQSGWASARPAARGDRGGDDDGRAQRCSDRQASSRRGVSRRR